MLCEMITLLLCLLLAPAPADLVEVEVKDRVDCHPEPGAYQQRCEDRGCVW